MSSGGKPELADRLRDLEGQVKEFILAKDWSTTPLGDMKDWSQSLNSAVSLCLNSRFPIAIWWGKDLVNIYNESFRHLLNLNNCEGLGVASPEIWPGFIDDMGLSLGRVLQDGLPTLTNKDLKLGSGKISLSFYNSAIYDEPGRIGGVFTAVVHSGKSVPSIEDDSAEGQMTLNDELEEKVRQRTILLEMRNEELKRSEERYTKMTEEVEDYAIILLDVNGTILNWNKGAQKIKGYAESEIIGRNFSIFYREEDRARDLPGTLIQTAIREGRAAHEGYRKRKDNTTFWGSVVITALHDERGKVIGFTKVTRDLTERKAAEDLIRQHASELEVKNKQLEQFAYIASHDLQEPLRKIQTFVQVLEKKFEDEALRQKYFAKINSAAKRMADLVQSVLNYSRLSQSSELWSTVDLNEIMENVLADYELLISEKDAVIKYDPLPVVAGIRPQLGQLFANLVGNSLKFSREKPIIRISWRQLTSHEIRQRLPSADISKEFIELSFSDNGIGFEQQYADKIFNIFQRLNSRDEFAGTGIGLALSKKIVENHNGCIRAKSEVGEGATFFISLPYK